MMRGVLVLNAGSSSIKFSVYVLEKARTLLQLSCHGLIEAIGSARPSVRITDAVGQPRTLTWPALAKGAAYNHHLALIDLMEWLGSGPELPAIHAVGHRVVHGGQMYWSPQLITETVLETLQQFVPLAPLHQPHNLASIRILAERHPDIPQVACFDTAFHHSQPELARLFALPREYWESGIQRYGFHGLSYEYIASRLPGYAGDAAYGRVVVAHLGNGASMCALRGLKSIASTMGFTALEGLPMGTRCGALDPGVILYLMQEQHMGEQELTELLYRRSGLLGLSGVSNDMRTLLASREPAARQAVDYFVYRIARELGSLVAALGGLDALVFTGGIGEHAAEIRAKVCAAGQWLGIECDANRNQAGGPLISTDDSLVSVWVIPTDEELMIARHTCRLAMGAEPE